MTTTESTSPKRKRANPNAGFLADMVVIVIFSLAALFIAYLGVVAGWWGSNTIINELLGRHSAAMIGVPLAALISLFVVLLLEHTAGTVAFELPGVKFEGAAAPIVFWVFCFGVVVIAVTSAW